MVDHVFVIRFAPSNANGRRCQRFVTFAAAQKCIADVALTVLIDRSIRCDQCGLGSYTAQGAHGDFRLLGHDCRVHNPALRVHELDMTALLALLYEPCPFKPALDLAEGRRAKPRQPQPRRSKAWVDASPAAARNAVPVPPSDLPRPLVRSLPGWRHRLQGTAIYTNRLRAAR